jgi:hypothetical protein
MLEQPVELRQTNKIMRMPIKLNRVTWPRFLTEALPSAEDPRILLDQTIKAEDFTKAISTFKFGTTFKTTQKARFPLTLNAIRKLQFDKPPVVIDIGASDGSTSLDVIESLAFKRYYVTDLNIEVLYKSKGSKGYFYDCNGLPVLVVSDWWIVYSDTSHAIFPFGRFAGRMLRGAPELGSDSARLLLVNPDLRANLGDKVIFKRHNALEPWEGEHADFVLIANILNRSYFSDDKIVTALRQVRDMMNESGYAAIVESRMAERATIFQLQQGELIRVQQINGGAEIEFLACQVFAD